MTKHLEFRLNSVGDALFDVSQDWVHQNTVNNLDDGIDEDGKGKDR